MSATSSASAISAENAAAIRAIVHRQVDAWNRHDMDAFVADTTPEADWINVRRHALEDVTLCTGRMQ
jgi:hypothetical protein